MKTPQSSNIAEIKYKKNILTVEFKPNTKKTKDAVQEFVYEFQNVPEEIWNKFKETHKKKESIGKLFASEIKNKFEFVKTKKGEKKNASNKTGMENNKDGNNTVGKC